MYSYVYETFIGSLTVHCSETHVISVEYGNTIHDQSKQCETDLHKEVYKQLQEYFLRKRKVFDLPLELKGTPFQIEVWKSLMSIPYGETRSYEEIAKMIGKPKACRAVGNANNKNKIPVIIPCHRVIGKNGNLTGYALGLDIKEKLLKLERNE